MQIRHRTHFHQGGSRENHKARLIHFV